MTFNIEKAKAAGYSDDEIESYLAKNSGPKKFNIEKAKEAGYSDEEIEDYLAEKNASKAFGKEGSIVGGQLGSFINNPVQGIKELPGVVARGLEFPVVEAPQGIADLLSQILGPANAPEERKTFLSHLTAPQKTKLASQLLADYVREGLPPHLKEEAQEIADLESMLLPLFGKFAGKGIEGAKKIGSKLKIPPEPNIPPPSGPIEFRPTLEKGLEKGKELGQKAKKSLFGPNLSEEIPQSLSKERIKNTTSAGMELEKAISETYEELTKQEKKAYEVSKKANKSVEAIHPELVQDLQASIKELEKIPDPSAPLKRYIESSKKLLKNMAEIDMNGTVHGYKPISNQILIEQAQEYNQIPKFDFPTDTKTGIFKSLIKKLNNAIDKTAANHPKANAAWQKAKEIHSRKSELFADPDVFKWTKLADKNYSKEFLSSVDIDKIRKKTPVLEMSNRGKDSLQKLKRELVERMFEEYFPVGRRFDKKQIARALDELEVILTKEELNIIKGLFEEAQTPGAKAAEIISKVYRYFKRPSTAVKEIGKIQ